MHLIDIILIVILVAAVACAVRTYRKKGSCSCGGSCEGCQAAQLTGGCAGCNKCSTTQK